MSQESKKPETSKTSDHDAQETTSAPAETTAAPADVKATVEAKTAHHRILTPEEQRTAFIRLMLLVIAGALAAWRTDTIKTVGVLLAIVVMIMIHELGHFIMAKLAHMKVTEYFLGFGPRIWSFRRGETEYGVKALFLLGGYVRIIGMHSAEKIDPQDEPRTYRQKSYLRRFSVVVAGSVMHFVMAFGLLFWLIAVIGQPTGELLMEVGSLSALDNGKVSPAQRAGIKVDDKIISVDGQKLKSFDELPPYVISRAGKPIRFELERNGARITRTVIPVDLRTVEVDGKPVIDSRKPHGFIGVGAEPEIKTADPITAIGRSGDQLWLITVESVKGLGRILQPDTLRSYGERILDRNSPETQVEPETRLLSPVGIVRISSQAADSGLRDVITLLVLINVFVGIFNMLPLLPFDGGYVAIATYEAVRSRFSGRRHHVNIKRLTIPIYLVMCTIIFVSLFSVYMDITDPQSNPFK